MLRADPTLTKAEYWYASQPHFAVLTRGGPKWPSWRHHYPVTLDEQCTLQVMVETLADYPDSR